MKKPLPALYCFLCRVLIRKGKAGDTASTLGICLACREKTKAKAKEANPTKISEVFVS